MNLPTKENIRNRNKGIMFMVLVVILVLPKAKLFQNLFVVQNNVDVRLVNDINDTGADLDDNDDVNGDL